MMLYQFVVTRDISVKGRFGFGSRTLNDAVSVRCDSRYLSKGTVRFGFDNRNFIPARVRIFFSPSNPDRKLGSHGFLSRGCWVSLQRVKRIVQGGHHPHPFSSDI